jgi:hypothetical protein
MVLNAIKSVKSVVGEPARHSLTRRCVELLGLNNFFDYKIKRKHFQAVVKFNRFNLEDELVRQRCTEINTIC